MNYLLLSDCLWYLGHIMTGSSILFTHDNYYLAIAFVSFGQCITIISRPIGRITTNQNKNTIKAENEILDIV